MEWNSLSWGMDNWLHHTVYWVYDYLSTPALKLSHVGKREPREPLQYKNTILSIDEMVLVVNIVDADCLNKS